MATALGQHDPGLTPLQAFFKKPFEVGFFQAVRLLRRWLPARKPVGRFFPPTSEVARFVAHPSFVFPASEIQEAALLGGDSSPATMQVNFMGLSSPQGVLPTSYTELLLD